MAVVETPTVVAGSVGEARAETVFGVSVGGALTSLSSLQAGAHPDLTTSTAFNTVDGEGALAGDPKDFTDDLPGGFAGDLVDTPACSPAVFLAEECAVDTQVGVITVTLTGELAGPHIEPVYNLSAGPGEVAKLGFSIGGDFFYEGDIAVRPSDYGLRATFYNATAGPTGVDSAALTVWGVPAEAVHDALRWTGHLANGHFGAAFEGTAAPYFTNPTSCGGEPLVAEFSVDSWEHPEEFAHVGMPFGPIVGCDRLGMAPAVSAEATTSSASAPTGLVLDTRVPQTYNNAEGLATSTLKREVVTLPEGMTVNPSAGAGLGACSQAQFEEEPIQYTPDVGCPNDSKLGTIRIQTPSLKEEVTGSVFLAEPYQNEFGSLIALYVVARIPDRGLLVKLAGKTEANPETGQLVTTFDDLPPLPFSLAAFSFRQGETSPLVSPPACGDYTVQAALTPWSNPEAPPLMPLVAPFPVTSSFDGGPCPAGGVPPFAPQLVAGTQNNAAGAYSPMYLRISRGDGEQEITGFSSQLPPGLSANLTGIPFCGETEIAQARVKTGTQEETEPSCPAASEIGHTIAEVGVGSVLAQAPGRIYLAGPFEGAPFSIVAVTSSHVGPFDLGTVVVHLPLQINPETAAVTIPPGPADQIPHIIKGIVVHLRTIRVYIDRPDFTINPTSCQPMRYTATIIGSGASFTNPNDDIPVTVSDPFQAADCQNLAFKPVFTASTSGKTSKANGASLTVNLAYPKAPQGTQANIAKVKVELPKILPSRLTTLQKACTEQTFNQNPASCPAASIIGHATAHTPILPVPLTGPAYFVSHGGAKFPELVMVLQGYGITIDLRSETFISKTGVTSSTLHAVPDQPVTSFQLTLPQGPYSALAATGNLCTQNPTMPTSFVAQNGTTTQQNTKITVTGCPKHKPKPKPKKTKHTKKK